MYRTPSYHYKKESNKSQTGIEFEFAYISADSAIIGHVRAYDSAGVTVLFFGGIKSQCLEYSRTRTLSRDAVSCPDEGRNAVNAVRSSSLRVGFKVTSVGER